MTGTFVIDSTTPYPWPYDAALDLERCALVVVGWDSHGWANCVDPGRAVDATTKLSAALGSTVIVTRSAASLGGRGSPRSRLAKLPALPGARAISCAGIDAFYGGPLDHLLRRHGKDQLLLAGLGLETAVHSTLRSANDRGYECLLVVDACAPLDPTMVGPAVSMVEMSGGIFGAVGATHPVLAALAAARPPGGSP